MLPAHSFPKHSLSACAPRLNRQVSHSARETDCEQAPRCTAVAVSPQSTQTTMCGEFSATNTVAAVAHLLSKPHSNHDSNGKRHSYAMDGKRINVAAQITCAARIVAPTLAVTRTTRTLNLRPHQPYVSSFVLRFSLPLARYPG